MFNSLLEDIKSTYRDGHTLTRIIIINIGVFVITSLLFLFLNGGHTIDSPSMYHDIVNTISINSNPWDLLMRFWANFTHMFVHADFWHLLWNMLFLFWFGRIVGEMIGDRHIIPLYILGGLFGAVFFVLGNQLVNYQGMVHYAVGASASVMAMVVAAGMIAPDYNLNLLVIGRTPLKYVVLVLVFLDILGTAGTTNTGGHFAHIGGVVLGVIYIWQLKRGVDFSKPFGFIMDLFQRSTNASSRQFKVIRNEDKPVYRRPTRAQAHKKQSQESTVHQARVDAILDKIKEVGYENLSKEEKEYLFLAAKDK